MSDSEEEAFKRFMEDDDGLKPIDTDAKPKAPAAAEGAPRVSGTAALDDDDEGDFEARKAAAQKAIEEEFLDPIALQAAREAAEALQKEANLLGPSAFDDEIEYIKPGAQVDLLQRVPILKYLKVGAGWDQKSPDDVIDVDMSAFLLGNRDETRIDEDFIFYNNESGCEGAIRHRGDSRTGAGDGDDEEVFIELNALPFDIFKIVFVLSVYEEIDAGKHLGLIDNLYLRLVNSEDNREICRMSFPSSLVNKHKGVYACVLIREGPNWILENLAAPFEHGNLATPAKKYGILIKELQSTEGQAV